MIKKSHLLELVARYCQQGQHHPVTESEASEQLSVWVKHYGSEQKVYDELCAYFRVQPQYITSGNDRFDNSTLKKTCDCGAKHTSFPNFHSTWCSAYRSK